MPNVNVATQSGYVPRTLWLRSPHLKVVAVVIQKHGEKQVRLNNRTTQLKAKSGLSRIKYIYSINAKKRGYSWELSDVELSTLISDNCHYCGSKPSNINKPNRSNPFTYQGIDRDRQQSWIYS